MKIIPNTTSSCTPFYTVLNVPSYVIYIQQIKPTIMNILTTILTLDKNKNN